MKDYKELFPVYNNNKDLVYLDSAASALKASCVIDAVSDYYNNYSTNIERGLYKLSLNATKKVEEARRNIASFINAKPNEVIFTRGTTESLNQIALSLRNILKEGDEVITSLTEHHSSFLPLLNLFKEIGIKLVFVPLNDKHEVTIDNIKKVVTKNTKLIALAHVTNVLGTKLDVKEVTSFAHENNILVSIDGAQAIPHMKIDVKELDVDFYSFSFHKMCGPTGLGILYAKEKILNSIEPAFLGGEMNDEVTRTSVLYKDLPYKFEAGTLPIAEIFGANACINLLHEIGYDEIHERTAKLRDFAVSELSKIEEVEIYNLDSESSLIAFNIKGVHSHDAIEAYSDKGICMRAGHHCAELLHTDVLKVSSTLRASFYFYNDMEDAKRFIEVTKEVINFFKEVGYIG